MLSCFNKLLASQARFDRDTNGPVFWRNKIWRWMLDVRSLSVLFASFGVLYVFTHWFFKDDFTFAFWCIWWQWEWQHSYLLWFKLACVTLSTFNMLKNDIWGYPLCLNVTPKSFCLESICDLLRLSPVSSLPWDRALTPKDTFCLLDVGDSDKAAHDWEWDSLSHIATTLLSC